MSESQTTSVPYESMIEKGREEQCVASTDPKLPSESSHEAVTIYLSKIAASKLRPHPKNVQIMRRATAEEDRELEESIRAYGVQRSLLVTDESCASGYGKVLRGNRRWHIAVACDLDVPVDWASGLSAEQEEDLIAQGNALDQIGRRLTEADLAQVEDYIWRREERGAGFREDLAAQNGQTSGELARGSSVRKIVAAAVMRPESQVRARHAIYYDPASPNVLKDAVTSKKVSLSRGYQLVVEARQAFKVPTNSPAAAANDDGIQLPEDPAISEARADIVLKLNQLLGTKPPKPKSSSSTPKIPRVVPRASFKLSDGVQKVKLGQRTILAIPRGESVELCEAAGSAQPAPGGPHEQRQITLDNSMEAVRNVLAELPEQFTEGMRIVDVEVCDPRLMHQAKIVIGGHHDLQSGEICITWWWSEKDWWGDNPPDIRVKSKPNIPAVHIESKLSQKDELVYYEVKHPYNTVGTLMSVLQKLIMFELGPTCGVKYVDRCWVDRNGAKLILPTYRAPMAWNPMTPVSIACPVSVEPFADIERLTVHTPTVDDLDVFGHLLDFDRLRKSGQYPQFCKLPCEAYGYPFRDGYALESLLLGRRVSEAAVLARASGFAVRPPDFLDTERPELANTWFLAVFAFHAESDAKVILVDVGWTDNRGTSRGVLTPMPAMRGMVECAAFHAISAVGIAGEPYPVQILIDMRFATRENKRCRESLPITGTGYDHCDILDDL